MLNKVGLMYRNILLKKMNSTQEALKEFEKIEYWVSFMKIFFWVSLFLIFYISYYSDNSIESYYGVVVAIFIVLIMALYPLWSHFNEIVDHSYSEKKFCLENLNLHIGDKVDFIEEDGYRREGELTRISMSWFEFRYKDSIGIIKWLAFKEKNYILVWTKHAGEGIEKVTTSRFLKPYDERIEIFTERLNKKIKSNKYLKTAEISTDINLNNILVLTCTVEIVAGKRNYYEMLTELNSLISSTMREMKMYYYDGITHTFTNNYH